MIARLTALSISSIDISMLIALRRARKPNVPIANRSAGEDEVGVEALRDAVEEARASVGLPGSRLARKTPPITAARSRTLTTSNGRM